jgi:hypothetical protein
MTSAEPERFHVEWTDECRGELTIGGHLLPYSALTIDHTADQGPQLTVTLPLDVCGGTIVVDAKVAFCEATRTALIAMGWTPPGEAACEHAEWLCPACRTVYPIHPHDRFVKVCRGCGADMHLSSPNRREIERLRAELALAERQAADDRAALQRQELIDAGWTPPGEVPADHVVAVALLTHDFTERPGELLLTLADGRQYNYPVAQDSGWGIGGSPRHKGRQFDLGPRHQVDETAPSVVAVENIAGRDDLEWHACPLTGATVVLDQITGDPAELNLHLPDGTRVVYPVTRSGLHTVRPQDRHFEVGPPTVIPGLRP